MSEIKYVSPGRLSYFLDKLKELFATVVHDHDSQYDPKGSADTVLQNAKSYTDTAVAQKTQVQIITWEADD